MPKPQKFKYFTVTDIDGLAEAFPGVVNMEPRADPFKVRKLLDCGVDLSQWVTRREPQEEMLTGEDVATGGIAE